MIDVWQKLLELIRHDPNASFEINAATRAATMAGYAIKISYKNESYLIDYPCEDMAFNALVWLEGMRK